MSCDLKVNNEKGERLGKKFQLLDKKSQYNNFNTRVFIFFLHQVASYSALGIWFIITVFSGRNFKKSLFEMKASEYYLTDERMAYSSPIQEIPFYEVTSDRGSRYL